MNQKYEYCEFAWTQGLIEGEVSMLFKESSATLLPMREEIEEKMNRMTRAIQALNYLDSLGWELVSTYRIEDESQVFYIMRKPVSSFLNSL